MKTKQKGMALLAAFPLLWAVMFGGMGAAMVIDANNDADDQAEVQVDQQSNKAPCPLREQQESL